MTGYLDYVDIYIAGGGPRHSKYYRCTGSEQRLSDCDYYTETNMSYGEIDAGMDCNLGKYYTYCYLRARVYLDNITLTPYKQP